MILVKLYSFTWLYWQYFQVKFIKSDKSYIWEIIPLKSVYTVYIGCSRKKQGGREMGGMAGSYIMPEQQQHTFYIHMFAFTVTLPPPLLLPPPPSFMGSTLASAHTHK